MVEIIPKQKNISNSNRGGTLPYWEDETGGFDVAGIDVDDDSYDTGAFLDRDYDVRFFKGISILLENLGPNDVLYTILSTTKDFDNLDEDLNDDDFTEVEKAETAIVAGSQATGSVEVTGGPSTKAEGDLTLVSVQVGETPVINGLPYEAISGSKAGDNTKFDISGTDTQAATDLADSITNDSRTPITVPTIDVTATSAIGVVTVEAPLNDGAAGNAIDTVGSANITAASGTLLSGVTSFMSSIDIAGVEIMDGINVNWRTSDTLTGDDVATNINGHTSSPNYTAVNVAGVVTITRVGSTPDTGTVTSTTTVMTTTDINMTGGTKGVSAVTNIERLTPQQTAIRIRAKEASGGSPGKIRGDVKFL